MKSPAVAADRFAFAAGQSQRIRVAGAAIFAATSFGLLLQADDPLWLDELHTVWTARGSWSETLERSALGNQSPPFFVLESLVGRVAGYGPQAMRFLSVLAGAASVVTLFGFVARTSRSIVLGAAFSLSLLAWPTLCFYFVEARPYALVFFAATTLWTSLAEALSSRLRAEAGDDDANVRRLVRARVLWVAGLLSAIWLHPTALLLVVPVTLALVVSLKDPRGRATYSAGARALDFGIAATICAAGAPFWYALFQRRGAWSAFIRVPDLWSFVVDFQLLAFVAVPSFAVVAALVLALVRREPKAGFATNGASFGSVALFGLAFAAPVLIAIVGTWSDLARVYHFRYLIGAVAALPAFAAATLLVASPGWVRASGTALFLGVLFWFGGGAATLVATGRIVPASRQERWADLVERLDQSPDGPIVLDADVIESKRWAETNELRKLEYLAFALRAFPPMEGRTMHSVSYDPHDGVELPRHAVAEAQESGRLYAVIRGGGAAPAKMMRRMKQALPKGFANEPAIESFGRVWLLTYERDRSTP